MKKVFIIHGWGGNPKEGWFPWLKKELESKNFQVTIPAMPNTFKPKINEWVSHLKKIIKNPDEDTYFIGHSIGCQTILRYLESLNKKIKIGGAIFVAGWFNLSDETWDEDYTERIAKPWIKTEIDFDKVKSHTNKFIDIASDNDPYVPLSDINLFKEKLGAKIIVLKKKGHISGYDKITKLPIVLDELLKW